MTKNIIIGILLLICAFMSIMAYVQKEEAIRQNNMVKANLLQSEGEQETLNDQISELKTVVDSLQSRIQDCSASN